MRYQYTSQRNVSCKLSTAVALLLLATVTSAAALPKDGAGIAVRQNNLDPNHYLHCVGTYNSSLTATAFCGAGIATCLASNPTTTPLITGSIDTSTPTASSDDQNDDPGFCTQSCQCHVANTTVQPSSNWEVSTNLWLLDCDGNAPADTPPATDINTYCQAVTYCDTGMNDAWVVTAFPLNSTINAACKSQCSCNAYIPLPGQDEETQGGSSGFGGDLSSNDAVMPGQWINGRTR